VSVTRTAEKQKGQERQWRRGKLLSAAYVAGWGLVPTPSAWWCPPRAQQEHSR